MMLSACSDKLTRCPARERFTGATYGDLLYYDSDLQAAYDACASPK